MINRTSYFFLLFTIPLISHASNSIRIENIAISDRDTGSIYITMKSDIPVNGLNFLVSFDPSIIRPISISPVGRALASIGTDASIYARDRMSFIVFDRNGSSVPADSGRIFEIRFAVNDSILSHDTTTQILFFESSVADSTLALVPFVYEHGVVAIHHITGVKPPQADVPIQFELFQNYPNPFNPTTRIRIALPYASNISLVIFNILGQEVRTFSPQVQNAGVHTVDWDGRSNAGIPVATGAYFYRLEARSLHIGGPHYEDIKKMLLLK